MRINGKPRLDEFMRKHADARGDIRAWRREVEAAQWATSADVKAHYPKASIIDNRWVVFDICGKRYRLAVKVNYVAGVVLVKKLGTHSQYNKWRYD
jgi:mRNA interferase HigB